MEIREDCLSFKNNFYKTDSTLRVERTTIEQMF